jgi:transposase-like protein
MTRKCPKCCAQKSFLQKYGHFFRKSDSQKIQRWRCRKCGKHFSSATFSACYGQNKRRLNSVIRKLLISQVSHRRIALILGINRKTVRRKQAFLGEIAKQNHQKRIEGKVFDHIQFDDLETIEHTKLNPVSVPVVVSCSRKILGFKVARIPAKGHLAKISRKKYGKRANEVPQKRDELFAEIKNWIHPCATVESDCHPHYPEVLKRHLPRCLHLTYLSDRATVAGQGELKRKKYDPIFKINHTLAMLRANIHRLIRRTWNTTKCLKSLEEQLWIYVDFHNSELTS